MSKKDFCWCPSCQWPICDTFKKKTINVSVQLFIILWNFSLIYYIHEFIRWRYFKNIKFFFYSLIVFFHYYILSSCKKQVLYYRIHCIKYQLNTFFKIQEALLISSIPSWKKLLFKLKPLRQFWRLLENVEVLVMMKPQKLMNAKNYFRSNFSKTGEWISIDIYIVQCNNTNQFNSCLIHFIVQWRKWTTVEAQTGFALFRMLSWASA